MKSSEFAEIESKGILEILNIGNPVKFFIVKADEDSPEEVEEFKKYFGDTDCFLGVKVCPSCHGDDIHSDEIKHTSYCDKGPIHD